MALKPKAQARTRICLVCWQAEKAAGHAQDLGAAGFPVTLADTTGGGMITYFRNQQIDALVIDLDRLPSHGRELAVALRASQATRHLPLVFAYTGAPSAKVERVRAELPDAGFASWERIAGAIGHAVASPPQNPVQPRLEDAKNSRRADLVRRLGIKAGQPVVLWGEADFLRELLAGAGEQDNGAIIATRAHTGKDPQLYLCVTRTQAELEAVFGSVGLAAYEGSAIWIVHPKQTSRYRVDFNQNDVRMVGLAHGWVDFKVCAVDGDWSGLKFARRKTSERPRANALRAT